jgi:AraC-like DNA-binding protein
MGILSDILNQSQLKGGVYFCHTFTKEWGLDIKAPMGGVFHILISGSATVGYNGHKIKMSEGDIIALPKAMPHWVALDNAYKNRVPIKKFMSEYQFKLYNSKKSATDKTTLLCGHFNFNSPDFFPIFKELPECMHISTQTDNDIGWLKYLVIKMNQEAVNQSIGSRSYLSSLVELLFIDMVRYWLSRDDTNSIFLQAAKYPSVLKVLRIFHAKPEVNYKLDNLAALIGMSRASLHNKFTDALGVAPMVYLSRWRIYIASNLLVTTNLPIIEIALRVGYQSDSALSKKFKAEIGITPKKYRSTHK